MVPAAGSPSVLSPPVAAAPLPAFAQSSTALGLTFRYDVPAPRILEASSLARPEDIALDGSVVQIDDTDWTSAFGITLPTRAFTIALPPQGMPEVFVTVGDLHTQAGVDLAVPAKGGNRSGAAFPVSVAVHAPAWAQGAAWESPVVGAYVTQLRAQRVLRLVLAPASYVADGGSVVWTNHLDVAVRFGATGSDAATAAAAAVQDPFESVYASTLLNYAQGRAWRIPRALPGVVGAQALTGGDGFTSSGGNPWLKIAVQEHGLYKVGYDQLKSAGFSDADIRLVDPSTLRVYTGGGGELRTAEQGSPSDWMSQVSAIVGDAGTAGVFEQGDYVAFYGWGTHGNEWEWNVSAAPGFEGCRAADDLWYDNPYTADNIYWITWGGSFSEPLARAGSRASDTTPGAPAPASFTWRVHREQNTTYDPELGTLQGAGCLFGCRWERWWWEELAEGNGAKYSITALPNIVTGQPVRFRGRFWGSSQSRVRCVKEHNLEVKVNGIVVARRSWSYPMAMDIDTTGVFLDTARDSVTYQSQVVRDSLTCLGQTGVNTLKSDVIRLAWYELDYQRSFVATNDWLEFTAPAAGAVTAQRFVLRGFSSGAAVRVWDVTDRLHPREVLPVTARLSGEEGASLVVQDTLGTRPHRYIATTLAAATVKTPTVARFAGRRLRDAASHADYIVITHPSFVGAARTLAGYRYHNVPFVANADTAVVTTTQIFDEFSWGVVDPAAIRNFLAYAFNYWTANPSTNCGPSYAVLVGDASWDFRNFYGSNEGSKSFVPGYVGDGPCQSYLTDVLSDTWYVSVDPVLGRDLCDMYIGRLPVRTDDQARVMIEQKLIPFERTPDYGPWRSKFALLADDQYDGCTGSGASLTHHIDGIGLLHTSQSEAVAAGHVPDELDEVKLYAISSKFSEGECVKRAMHDVVQQTINDGVALFNYVGHGWWDVLGHEQYMRISDVPSLHNGPRLLSFIAASCAVGKFDEPNTEGISEVMVKMGGGGAIATFSATDLAFSVTNASLDTTLMNDLFPGHTTRNAQTFGAAAIGASLRRSNAEQYAILGDPAIRPGVAARGVDVALTGGGLSTGGSATVTGTVLTEQGSVDAGYTGIANVEVRGPWVAVDGAGDGSLDPTSACRQPGAFPVCQTLDDYARPGDVVFRGDVAVQQGRFSSTFVVPADTTLLGSSARVRVYVSPAGSGPRLDATGAATGVRVAAGEPESDAGVDSLTLQFPSSSAAVSPTAVLRIRVADSHGINLTGQAGSQVNVILDGTTYDLTGSFVYDQGSHTAGTAHFTLPNVRLGPHTIHVAASDTYGNRAIFPQSLTPLRFEVADAGPLSVRRVLTYPGGPGGQWILAQLGETGPASGLRMQVAVYSVAGRLVRLLSGDVTPAGTGLSRQAGLLWDLRDADGDPVAAGTYLYKVRLSDAAASTSVEAMGRGAVTPR